MSDHLRELYQEVIVEHGRHPRNFGALEGATHRLRGLNPLCGDKLELFVIVEAGKIKKAQFSGTGCAISMASASLMTEAVQGMRLEEAKILFENFHQMLADQKDPDESLGKLVTLAGVKQFPARVKCATLAWHTLDGILSGAKDDISTE